MTEGSPTGDTAQTTTTRMCASIRDQLASEIIASVYPAGALLPSIVHSSRRGSGWRQGMASTAC